jgi:hypothetical protein
MLLLLRFLVLNHGFSTSPKEDSVKKKNRKQKMIATKIWLSVVTRLLMSIIIHIIYIANQ